MGEVIRRVHPTIEVEADDLVTLLYSVLNVGGTVVGLKQQPLAGVDVWLQSDYGTGAATHVTTDARGRFSLHVSRAAFNSAGWKTAILWVYRDGHELFVRNLSDLRMEDPDDRLLDQIIGLDAEPESALTVIARDDGTALAGVRVVPYCLRLRDELYPTLPPRLQAKLVRTTDGDGRVVIRGVPHHNLFDVRLETADRGTHEFNLRLDGYDETDRTIQLGSVGSISGQVTADDPSVLQDLTLYFRTSDPAWSESRFADADSESLKRMLRESDWSDLPRRSQGVATVKVSPDGRFTIPALATGRLRMHTSLSADLPFGVRMSQVPVVIEAGQTMTLPMHSAPRVTVRSSLTDEDSNEVTSRTVLRIDDGEGLHDDHVIFKGGQFETQVLAGDVRFVIENLLDERDGTWTQLDGLPFAVADDDEEPVELPAIRIQIQRNTSNR